MKLSDYIVELQNIFENHGDLEVQTSGPGGRREAPEPSIAYARILKGRESKPRFWWWADEEDRKGDKVCRV